MSRSGLERQGRIGRMPTELDLAQSRCSQRATERGRAEEVRPLAEGPRAQLQGLLQRGVVVQRGSAEDHGLQPMQPRQSAADESDVLPQQPHQGMGQVDVPRRGQLAEVRRGDLGRQRCSPVRVDVAHEQVDLAPVAAPGELRQLLEGPGLEQHPAQTDQGAAAQRGATDARALVASDLQNRGARSEAHQHIARGKLEALAPLRVGAPLLPLAGKTLDGKIFVPEQNITVEQALRCYTTSAAYACFMEDRLGMIKPGYLADIVILNEDVLSIPAARIADVTVHTTIVGGAIAWQNNPAKPPIKP